MGSAAHAWAESVPRLHLHWRVEHQQFKDGDVSRCDKYAEYGGGGESVCCDLGTVWCQKLCNRQRRDGVVSDRRTVLT